MKYAALLLIACAGAMGAGAAAAAEQPAPVLPDLDYCARRDADPEKCVIQDGPPRRRAIVREKGSPAPAVPHSGSQQGRSGAR